MFNIYKQGGRYLAVSVIVKQLFHIQSLTARMFSRSIVQQLYRRGRVFGWSEVDRQSNITQYNIDRQFTLFSTIISIFTPDMHNIHTKLLYFVVL